MSQPAGQTPLVVFTSLAGAGAGLVAATAMFVAAGAPMSRQAVVVGVVLQAVGLAVSLTHLGRPLRATLALTRVGRSALSNEVLMATQSLMWGVGLVALTATGRSVKAVPLFAGAFSVLFLVSIGLVYRIRGQASWGGASICTPLTSGCLFGAITIRTLMGPGTPVTPLLLVLTLDAVMFLLRWRAIARLRWPVEPDRATTFLRRDRWLSARLVLLDAFPISLLIVWPTPLVIGVAAAGLVIDRWSFYAFGLPHTTEREIGRAEDAIATASIPQEP
ncbi:MAG: dimethyl sulfoxide reductase anchor subunit [Acidobacteria bacterium]|nr:dimethyl sulfoxide reductase anchor subunit [Acidobacteriota bacterium]